MSQLFIDFGRCDLDRIRQLGLFDDDIVRSRRCYLFNEITYILWQKRKLQEANRRFRECV